MGLGRDRSGLWIICVLAVHGITGNPVTDASTGPRSWATGTVAICCSLANREDAQQESARGRIWIRSISRNHCGVMMISKNFSGIQGFPDRLDKAIRESGKTFGQVCRETRICRTTLYNLKIGSQGPSALQIARLSTCLGCSSDWLLGIKNVL